jgi:hypothetical protein
MAVHPCNKCGQMIDYRPGPASIVLSCPTCFHSTVLRRVPPKTSAPSPGNDSGSFWQTAGGSLIGVAGLVAALVIAGQLRGGRAAKPAPRQETEVTAERATASSMRSERSPSAADQVTPTEYDSLTHETGPAAGSYGAIVDRDLAIPKNAPLVAWLNTPRPALEPVTPRWLPLPFARWEDHSNRVYQENGIDYHSDREPLRFNVNLKVDHALVDAIERQFGRPQDAQQPTSWSFEQGGTRKPLDLVLDRKSKEIQSAHGYRVDDQVMGPDYEWLIDTSASTCAIVAPAVVAAYTGKPVAATTARERLEALASYVQNAIPYRLEVDAEMARFHADGKERFGIRPPAATLLRGGDCDSKSLLLAALLRAVDSRLPMALVHVKCTGNGGSGPEPHTLLGVQLPNHREAEHAATIGDRRLILVETTHGSFDRDNPFDRGIGRIADDTDWSGSSVDWIRAR